MLQDSEIYMKESQHVYTRVMSHVWKGHLNDSHVWVKEVSREGIEPMRLYGCGTRFISGISTADVDHD